jgi:hypothetical protein
MAETHAAHGKGHIKGRKDFRSPRETRGHAKVWAMQACNTATTPQLKSGWAKARWLLLDGCGMGSRLQQAARGAKAASAQPGSL